MDGCGYRLRMNNVWLMLDAAAAADVDGGGGVTVWMAVGTDYE